MIPKKIHYCWVGGSPLPESAIKCIRSWKKYCPDYEIIEWNEANYDFSSIPYMKEAYDAKKWAFVPDYARLDIVYRYGGIYLDTDVELIRPFDRLLLLQGFAGFEDDLHVAFGLGFGAEAGNPVIKKLMEAYDDLHFIGDDGELNLTASPVLNTDTLVRRCGLICNGKNQELDGLTVFSPEYFCPKSFEDGIVRKTKNTYSIHHYDASWFTGEQRMETTARWEYIQATEKRRKKRNKKLQRRRIFGGIFRKLFGDARWEKIKKRILGR